MLRFVEQENETINRSVLKLTPLEITCSGYDKKEGKVEYDVNKKQVSIERSEGGNSNNVADAVCIRNQPPRAAAKDTRWKSKIMLDARGSRRGCIAKSCSTRAYLCSSDICLELLTGFIKTSVLIRYFYLEPSNDRTI